MQSGRAATVPQPHATCVTMTHGLNTMFLYTHDFSEYYDKFSDKVDAASQEEKVPGLPPHMCCMIFGVGGGWYQWILPPTCVV